MSRDERGRGPSLVTRKMQAADTSCGNEESCQKPKVRPICRNVIKTYAELACQKRPRLCQPISSQDDVCLGSDRLWQLQEHASSLREALGHVKDYILKIVGQRAQIVPLIQLLGRGERVCHVRRRRRRHADLLFLICRASQKCLWHGVSCVILLK